MEDGAGEADFNWISIVQRTLCDDGGRCKVVDVCKAEVGCCEGRNIAQRGEGV